MTLLSLAENDSLGI